MSASGGCWEWTAHRDSCGYGVFALRPGVNRKAHRIAWWNKRGPIPEGAEVCHTCDNPSCVRPDHLFLGTHDDNMKDMKRKGRSRGVPGERNRHAKLSEAEVRKIREFADESGWSYPKLANKYGMSVYAIWTLVTGQHWTHVEGPVRPLNRRKGT